MNDIAEASLAEHPANKIAKNVLRRPFGASSSA